MKWFWIVLVIGLFVVFGIVAYRRGITISGLTIGGERRGETRSSNIPSCGECEKQSDLITENEKNIIMNLQDVNGVGIGLLNANNPNSEGILVNLKNRNLNTENYIQNLLQNRPYIITYGEVRAL